MSKKLYCNTLFLKNINGMFYYAIDYCGFENSIYLVIEGTPVHAALVLEGADCVAFSSIIEAIIWSLKNSSSHVFSPTPHPLPFLRNQVITFHDEYPFIGFSGHCKELLLKSFYKILRFRAFYINDRVGAFVRSLFPSIDATFAPNPIDLHEAALSKPSLNVKLLGGGGSIIVGLFGTDSRKKNYEGLFSSARQVSGRIDGRELRFKIYGERSEYIRGILDEFSDISIELTSASEQDISLFISSCDVVASVASGEGFGRPIAKAILHYKPVFLIDDPVFIEFFDRCANFYPSVIDLMDGIITYPHRADELIARRTLFAARCNYLNECSRAANESLRVAW